MTEPARRGAHELRFELLQAVGNPVAVPGIDLVVVLAKRPLEMLQYTEIVERVDLTSDQ